MPDYKSKYCKFKFKSIFIGGIAMKKFIIGLFTGIIILPACESLLELFMLYVEKWKIKPTTTINEWNKKNMVESGEGEVSNVIGFQYEPQEEYLDDDDYDE